jgi:hypothetical protein
MNDSVGSITFFEGSFTLPTAPAPCRWLDHNNKNVIIWFSTKFCKFFLCWSKEEVGTMLYARLMANHLFYGKEITQNVSPRKRKPTMLYLINILATSFQGISYRNCTQHDKKIIYVA